MVSRSDWPGATCEVTVKPADVGVALARRLCLGGSFDEVVGRGGDPQATALGRVDEAQPHPGGVVLLRDEWRCDRRCGPGVAGALRQRLVGDEFGLDDETYLGVHRLHLEADGSDGPLGEGHQSRGPHPDGVPRWRGPLADAVQQSGAQVERALVGAQGAVPQVEGFVVDEQPDDLPVGDVDDRLAGLGIPVPGLRVRQGPQLVDPVQVGAGQAVRFPFVEVAAPSDVAVRQGEDGFALREHVELQAALVEGPRIDGVRGVCDHRVSLRAPSPSTTVSAPCDRRSAAWSARSTPTT